MKKAGRKASTREPSKASLREMPEVNFTTGVVRRGEFAARIAKEGMTFHVTRGRPKKGTETGPTVPRSVRFPAEVWKHLEERAKAEGVTLHAALRAAVLAWTETPNAETESAMKESRRGSSRLNSTAELIAE